MKEKIQELANLWCRCNIHEVGARDFVHQFHSLFPIECTAAWNAHEGLIGEDVRIYELADSYFEAAHLVGIRQDKARRRRFQIVTELDHGLLRVRRLDLANGLERIHKDFLVPLEGARE